MTIIILFAVFLVLICLRFPLGTAMLVSAAISLLYSGEKSMGIIAARITSGLDSFPLLAIPLFILAGGLMNTGGVTRRIFDFASALMGHITGGLGHVNILGSIIFAGMSGSAMADAAGLGQIEIKAMTERGYDPAASAAMTAASCIISPIIPPSVIMIIYAVLAEQSVGHLFLGGVIPGVSLGILLMVFIYIGCKIKYYDFPREPKASFSQLLTASRAAILPMLAPVIILVCILTGITTPTEAGVVAVLYAITLGLGYREYNLNQLPGFFLDAVKANGGIMYVIASAYIFSWIVTSNDLGGMLAKLMLSISSSKWVALLFINIIGIILGCFIEGIAILIILVPVLVPIARSFGIDLVHLGVFMSMNVMIGLCTPPVGLALYVVANIAGVPMMAVFRKLIFLLIPLLVGLFLVTYVESLTLWLPHLLLGK